MPAISTFQSIDFQVYSRVLVTQRWRSCSGWTSTTASSSPGRSTISSWPSYTYQSSPGGIVVRFQYSLISTMIWYETSWVTQNCFVLLAKKRKYIISFLWLGKPISEAIVTNSKISMTPTAFCKISKMRSSFTRKRCDWNLTKWCSEHFAGNEWNSANCYSESENVTRDGVSAVSVRSNLSKSPVEEYWEWVGFLLFGWPDFPLPWSLF